MQSFKKKHKKNEQNNSLNVNKEIWNQETYDAWVQRFGEPKEAVKKIRKAPLKSLSVLYEKFGDVKEKKIMNLMGSNGSKAVALALLGAHATVVDFSEGNQRYAKELAHEAEVKIEYILSDVLTLSQEHLTGDYDIVFAEMGILHYFIDLNPFFDVVYKLLGNQGQFIIRDFHPVSTKLITSRGSTSKIRKHKVTGDYFNTSLEEKEVSFIKFLDQEKEPKKVLHRNWNLGEIVTAVAKAGLIIQSLDEEPNLSSEVFDKGIPKTFTLVAEKN
ncbi:class I SAM-dependent methyltransferase [Chengkuizengella sediminis]|uniref:class I SAM-dependent methyltransferase n=1 Tax=Chengkuizengella sediminis TaxID=1885917 RepID=UPI001389C5B3|nr:class I SAM-dependent methyltransferase [Chengkuizengella sediminis]NDI35459.1 class I SAM-dependent methyltransferase [Chengkuizengella sediminis]